MGALLLRRGKEVEVGECRGLLMKAGRDGKGLRLTGDGREREKGGERGNKEEREFPNVTVSRITNDH